MGGIERQTSKFWGDRETESYRDRDNVNPMRERDLGILDEKLRVKVGREKKDLVLEHDYMDYKSKSTSKSTTLWYS